jgi:multidrug efflux pump
MRRARPVALVALAAILAMIPLSKSAFWSPPAFTIMGGLSVATFLTLPAVSAFWHRRSLALKSEGTSERGPGFALPVGSATLAE